MNVRRGFREPTKDNEGPREQRQLEVLIPSPGCRNSVRTQSWKREDSEHSDLKIKKVGAGSEYRSFSLLFPLDLVPLILTGSVLEARGLGLFGNAVHRAQCSDAESRIETGKEWVKVGYGTWRNSTVLQSTCVRCYCAGRLIEGSSSCTWV